MYKSLNKKKVLLYFTENLLGSASTVLSCTLPILNPNVGALISSGTALLTSIAILITNDYVSELKKKDIVNHEIGLMVLHCYMRRL